MLGKWQKALEVSRRVSKPTAIVGIGMLLLGGATPLVGSLQEGLGKPQEVHSALARLSSSPGVEAFPSQVSNQRACLSEASAAVPVSESPSPLISPQARLANVEPLMAKTVTQLSGLQWPQIHEQARLARVPIVMYHDVLAEQQVSFDLTPAQLEAHLQLIRDRGLTPVTLDQVVQHLRSGAPLPEKPILLTFDDGYAGHFEYVYPLLKRYQMPAVFSIFTGKLDGQIAGRSTVTWEQLKVMAADPLVTIAAHSVTHPPDLTQLSDDVLRQEIVDSKARLEAELDIPIKYFTYPAGYYNARVAAAVADAGYLAALTMRQSEEKFAGESESLLAIERFGQSNLEGLLDLAWGGAPLTPATAPVAPTAPAPAAPTAPAPASAVTSFDFSAPVQATEATFEGVRLALISGGRPVTIHANSRYQVPEILTGTNAIAAVDGGFFSLEFLDSNVMIGPVLSQNNHRFIPGNPSENPRLNGRPLVLIAPAEVKFIPFDAAQHNTLNGLHQSLPGVTDAFVAAAWLVKDGQAQPAENFGNLFDFDASRHRAFWGINQAGQPVVGVSHSKVDSLSLARFLAEAGLRDAVMVDSGASTSLAFQGESLVEYTPRPVPHVVALIPPEAAIGACPLVMDVPDPAVSAAP